MTPEQKIKHLETQVLTLVRAAKQVLSDIDDDGVAERGDMGVWALRNAVANAAKFQARGKDQIGLSKGNGK